MQPRKLVPFDLSTLNVTLNNQPALEDFFERRKDKGGVLGHDIETTLHNDFFNRKMRTSQFGDTKEQHVQDLLELCDGDAELLAYCQGYYGKNLYKAPKLEAYVKSVQKVLDSQDFVKTGVNLGFEYMTWYWNFGVRMWNIWDCSQVERVIYAGAHSLKQYSFFAMDEMVERYMGFTVDKTLQTSFTIGDPLSWDQVTYAALDTRLPVGLKGSQQLVLNGRTAENNTNPANAHLLAYLDPIVTGDDINWPAKIENDCIGAFTDMHVHGDRVDTERWLTRVAKKKVLLQENVNELDLIFVPIVGTKHDIVTEQMIKDAKATWKFYADESIQEKELKRISANELDLNKAIRAAQKAGEGAWDLIAQKDALKIERLAKAALLASFRIEEKERLKKIASELGKKRTRINKLAAQCEGEALIHYKSNAQLLKQVQKMKGLGAIKSLDDDTLQAHKKKHKVMDLILTYHKLSKEIGTYGDQWAKCWTTHPCKEEGWLNPGDGRLHPVYNPFDAETGRSSSEKPNGQNLPTDIDIRQCFIADPPDEDEPDGYVIVTADMSGAELRIIAELAGDPIWIGAFSRGEDVHSVGTEILQGEKWKAATFFGGEKYFVKDKHGNDVEKIGKPCAYYALHTEESVKKNPLGTVGAQQKYKCECPGHKKLRDATKAINFLLAYGGGPQKLAQELGVTVDEAIALMQLHESMFPAVWAYLLKSGKAAKEKRKAFDMFKGRRIFPIPTEERAIEWCKEKKEEKLHHTEEICEKNIATYIVKNGKKPKGDDLYNLTHRKPTQKEIESAKTALAGATERQGKNHAIQGSNARIAKIAMGSGFDPNGKPYLWHTLRDFKAILIKFVHDELVVQCPKRFGEQVAALIGDAFKRAAAEKMTQVVMEFDYHINTYWEK